MMRRIIGVETEYAVGSPQASDRMPPFEQIATSILDYAHRRLCSLPDDSSNGVFLSSGARFYIDNGAHPELATPECDNPWDVVRYVRAGERMLERIAGEVGFLIHRCQVDYVSGATWGRHESYSSSCSPIELQQALVPHLVSRLIFTGAGGFDNHAAGAELLVSPRVSHLRHELSCESVSNRGIVHTKDEPLAAGGHHRLHLLCGESLCSDLATWLEVGTTAVVVAMIEARVCDPPPLRLRSPLPAMRKLARDDTCQERVLTEGGSEVRALDIQQHYLTLAEKHLGAGWMPEWAAEVCRQWRAILAALEQGPEAVATALDWAIKRALVRRHAERRGLHWQQLLAWNQVAERLLLAWRAHEPRRRVLSPDAPRSALPEVASAVARLAPFLRRHRIGWSDFESYLRLRQELCEIDLRFGQLGPGGIFRELDAAGALHHQVAGIDRIEAAMTEPPSQPRAQRRGELVRELAGGDGRYSADWQAIWDRRSRRYIDLSDPFARGGDWQTGPPGSFAELALPRLMRPRLRRRVQPGEA